MESKPRRRRTSWRPPTSERSERPSSPSNGEEIERSLTAAELLLREALEEQRHLQNRRIGALSLLVAIVAALGVLVALAESAGFGRGFGTALGVVAIFGVPTAALMARILMDTPREESARIQVAIQIAAMVGDVLPEIARREGWSYFRTEATRLRLSAFPLSPRRPAETVRNLFPTDAEPDH